MNALKHLKHPLSLAVLVAVALLIGLIHPATALVAGAALMAKAIESQGMTFQVSVGSPTSLVTINNITGFQGPGGSASVIDVSNLASSAKEKLIGLADEGQFTFDLNYDPDDAGHTALRGARTTRTRSEFVVTFTDTAGGSSATTARFYGYVLEFRVSGAVDQQVKAACSIEIDGAVTWA